MNLKKNIENIIKIYKNSDILESNRNELMATILCMIVTYCDIDQDKYHILSSYAIKDFKSVSDLDVNMEPSEWKKLSKSKMGKSGIYNNQKRYFIKLPSISQDAEIEIFNKKPTEAYPNDFFSHKKIKNKLIRDEYGNLYYPLNIFVEWKNTVHRLKDKKQLQLLNKKINDCTKTQKGSILLKKLGYNKKTEINKLLNKIQKYIDKW